MPAKLTRGVYPALLTFYDADERIDSDAVADHARRLIAAGVHGLVVAGSTGEFHLLEPSERRALLELVLEAAEGAVPVIAHVGAPTTAITCALAEHAVGAGAAAVMAVTPYYNRTDAAGLSDHLDNVARAAGDVPLLAYTMPAMAGTSYPVDLVIHLAREGVIAGVKESGDDLGRMLRLIAGGGPDFAAFSGSMTLLAPSMLAGGHGAILAAANVVPEACVAMFAAADSDDGAGALASHRRLEPLLAAIDAAGPAPAGYRAAAAARYGLSEAARRPLHPCGEPARRHIAEALEAALGQTPAC